MNNFTRQRLIGLQEKFRRESYRHARTLAKDRDVDQWEKNMQQAIYRHIAEQINNPAIVARMTPDLTKITREDFKYLNRFKNEIKRQLKTEEGISVPYVGNRASLYARTGTQSAWMADELRRLEGVNNDDYVAVYQTNSAAPCPACSDAAGASPYDPLTGAFPASVCYGRYHCHCTRTLVLKSSLKGKGKVQPKNVATLDRTAPDKMPLLQNDPKKIAEKLTIKEVTAQARRELGGLWYDFGTLDPVLIRKIIDELKLLKKEYPQYFNTIDYIGTQLNDVPKGVPQAGYMYWGRTASLAHSGWNTIDKSANYIGLNPNYFGWEADLLDTIKQLHDSGWLYASKATDLIRHEFGHIIDFGIRYDISRLPLGLREMAKGTLDDLLKILAEKKISRYSASNEWENFAENFLAQSPEVMNWIKLWQNMPTDREGIATAIDRFQRELSRGRYSFMDLFGGGIVPMEKAENTAAIRRLNARWKKEFPNTRLDLTGVEGHLAEETVRTFESLAKEYPDIFSYLEYVGTTMGRKLPAGVQRHTLRQWNDPNGDLLNTIAYATGTKAPFPLRMIAINPRYFSDPAVMEDLFRRVTKRDPDTGQSWTSAPPIAGSLTHEFGHVVDFWIRDKLMGVGLHAGDTLIDDIADVRSKMMLPYAEGGSRGDVMGKYAQGTGSFWGSMDEEEMFAELFATGNPLVRRWVDFWRKMPTDQAAARQYIRNNLERLRRDLAPETYPSYRQQWLFPELRP